jgi:light-regulated signal transduction histidine kinase (bacteriophytochrome)
MALLAALTPADADLQPFADETLAVERPELAEVLPAVAGVLVLPLGNAGDCLIWFRREILRTVDWLGAQSAAPTTGRPHCRRGTSFDSWRQTVTDYSALWEEMHVAEGALNLLATSTRCCSA